MGRGFTVRLRYVHEFRDRHGTVRRYFRRPGWAQVTLPGTPGSDEFMETYNAALAGHRVERKPVGEGGSLPGSVSAAIAGYYCDTSFTALSPITRKARRTILERFRVEHGEKRVALLRSDHIAKLISGRTPFVARDWLKALRGLMRFAAGIGLRPDDPTADIKPLKVRGGTIHTWSEDEIAIYESYYPVGTRERLAMALLLYTACRRSDMVRLGRQHTSAGRINYRQQKTGRALQIPIHPALAAIIDATPSGQLTFLATAAGASYSATGFGNAFRRWCDDAGLHGVSAHGLRKAAARRLAEAGCSAHEIASITGHKTLAEVQRYAAAADQARMAEAAMGRIGNAGLATPPKGLPKLETSR